jgi:hypothetical protein
MYSFVRRAGGENKKRMIIVEDRVEVFMSYGDANIARKINKFLEEKAAEIEEVIDIKLSTSPLSLLMIQTIRWLLLFLYTTK